MEALEQNLDDVIEQLETVDEIIGKEIDGSLMIKHLDGSEHDNLLFHSVMSYIYREKFSFVRNHRGYQIYKLERVINVQ